MDNHQERELRACPMCSSKVVWCECGKCGRVWCPTCEAMTEFSPPDECDTLEKERAFTAEKWNRRPSPSTQRQGEEVESLIPKGWVLNTADFSMLGAGLREHGWVMLKRDASGAREFYAIPDDDEVAREAFQLFVCGKGKTIREAIIDAARAAHPGDAAEGREKNEGKEN
jgi:uncharacterized Zn finger protein (UPF0148 family)